MSDASQGPGWWQASDGKWYAPELHPDFQPEPTQALPSEGPGEATQVVPPAGPPPEPTRVVPPVTAPVGPPPGGPIGPPLGGPPLPPPGGGRGKVIAAVVVAIVLLAAVLVLLLNRDKGNGGSVAASSSSSRSSSSESSPPTSTTTRRTTTTGAPTTTTAPVPTPAQLATALIKGNDLGSGFRDQPYTADQTSPAPCGQPSTDSQVPPKSIVAIRSTDPASGLAFIETIRAYTDEATAKKAYQLGKAGTSCSQASIGGQPFAISDQQDATAITGADESFAVTLTGEEGTIDGYAARVGRFIGTFQFDTPTGADTSSAPNPSDVVRLGVQRIKNL